MEPLQIPHRLKAIASGRGRDQAEGIFPDRISRYPPDTDPTRLSSLVPVALEAEEVHSGEIRIEVS